MGEIALRYYASYFDEKIHEEILRLLKEIKSKYHIDHEVVPVPKEAEHEVYRKDFVSRAKILNKRIGGSIARALRSRRGRGYIYLRGTLALTRKDRIEWFPSYIDPFYEKWKFHDQNAPTTIGFLKMVLEEGRSFLEKILDRPLGKAEHALIIDAFIESRYLAGKFELEVPIGKPMVIVDKYGKEKEVGKRMIDVVCKTPEATWIIEVKPQLDFQAIGQTLVYKNLYEKEHLGKVKCGIVCNYANEELYNISKTYIDKIFVMKKITRKGTINWR